MRIGPGFLVTAAFIGPGTITTASIAGSSFGFALTWALLLSIVMTLTFQEMSLRLGIVTGRGLSESLRESIRASWLLWPILILVVVAIGVGNAAYQTGNILGAVIGAETVTGLGREILIVAITILAAGLLASGFYRLIEGVLIALVGLMSLVFIVAMFIQPPDFAQVLRGFVPSFPPGSTTAILALIGTTVVPYNLFLHASAAQQKWQGGDIEHNLREARNDLRLSVLIGGLITFAIISTSAVAFYGSDISMTATTLANQLEPVLGSNARWLVASGLMAAGLTSAITAPLAAAFAVCGAFGWSLQMNSWPFRLVWLVVLLFGATFAILQARPVTAILVAQAANALILPVIAGILLWLMNTPALGSHRNTVATNALAAVLVLGVLALSIWKLL